MWALASRCGRACSRQSMQAYTPTPLSSLPQQAAAEELHSLSIQGLGTIFTCSSAASHRWSSSRSFAHLHSYTLPCASSSTPSLQGSLSDHSPSAHQSIRAYAAPPAATPPKSAVKRRRSHLKLYSVRNNKLRSNFEQVWPTLRLTEEEASLFKRNSRVFVTDLGKTIPLTTKFEMAKATQEKVPHTDARSLLYESDLHLDAVGEHPRFLKIRRLRSQFANKLQSLRKLRVLMGFAKRYELQELYELSLTQPGPDRVWKFICAMESKLPNTILRMGLANDILAAKKHVSNAAVAVNGTREPTPHAMHVQPADVIGPNDCSHDWFKGYMASQMGKDMRAMVGRSWGRSLARGDLEGARRAEVLHAFTEEASSGSKEEGSNS